MFAEYWNLYILVAFSQCAYEPLQRWSLHHGTQCWEKVSGMQVVRSSWGTGIRGRSQFRRVFYSQQPNGQSQLYNAREITKMDVKKKYVPRFACCVLTMSIGNLALAKPLKFSQDRTIPQFCFCQHMSCGIKILRCRSCLHRFSTPANSCVLKKIACGVCITLVKESIHITTVMASASTSCAFKDMTTPATFVFNYRCFFKEHINGWGPFFCHACLN